MSEGGGLSSDTDSAGSSALESGAMRFRLNFY